MRPFIAVLVATLSSSALAQDGGVDFRVRCARRIAANLLGQAPSTALLGTPDPRTAVEGLMAPAPVNADGGTDYTPFEDRFARWVNAKFNSVPGMTPQEDAPYYMARHVVQNRLPWRQMFVGQLRVDAVGAEDAKVVADTNGLGYFRNRAWMVRYAGNELNGYRLSAAYRMINNVLGVQLTAAQNTTGATSADRQSNPACSGCHFEPVFGLDLAARTLSRRVGTGTSMTFAAPTDGPQTLLGGQVISNDSQLINAMVSSTDFRFRACRIAMEFAYGRDEFKCEGPVFDRCIAAFTSSGLITDAIAAVATDPGYCQ